MHYFVTLGPFALAVVDVWLLCAHVCVPISFQQQRLLMKQLVITVLLQWL